MRVLSLDAGAEPTTSLTRLAETNPRPPPALSPAADAVPGDVRGPIP